MKNKKKNRSSYSLSAELKNALKYLLIWGMILIFSAYLLSDSEILGNVKQQERPDTWSMIGVEDALKRSLPAKRTVCPVWSFFFLQRVHRLLERFR